MPEIDNGVVVWRFGSKLLFGIVEPLVHQCILRSPLANELAKLSTKGETIGIFGITEI